MRTQYKDTLDSKVAVLDIWSCLFSDLMITAHVYLYCIRVTKSGAMRWAEYVARMGERRGAYRVSMY